MEEQPPGPPGRSRGRARGRPPGPPIDPDFMTSMQAIRISPTGSNGNGNGSNGKSGSNGNNDGAAVRGRGGYRAQTQELDTRPENVTQFVGTTGKVVKVLSNYLELNTPTNTIINNFVVKFEPEVEAIQMRKKMVYGIENLFSSAFLFDGMANIKTCDGNREERIHLVENPADADKKVQITIRWTEEVPWGSLEMLRMFNTQMRRNLQHLGYHLIGRNYFDAKSKKAIPEHKIELLMGLLTAIAQHDGGLYMVIDTTTKFIRSETVLVLLTQIRQRHGAQWFDEAKKQLCGSIVMTSYNNRTYKIDDLVTDKRVDTHQFSKGGRMITMVEYYKEFLNITIRQVNQPLIECLPSARDRRGGRTDKIILVPELCQMTGLTDQMRNDFKLMKQVGDISRHKPEDRVRNLNTFIEKLNSNEAVKTDMDKWNLHFNNKLVEINARELQCERIYMKDDDDRTAKGFDQKSGDFSKEMRSKYLFNPISLNKWMVIVSQRDSQITHNFVATITDLCRRMGINLAPPRITTLNDDRVGTYLNTLNTLQGSPCQMVVTIVPNNNRDRYDAIKKVCYCESPIPSQVILGRTLAKPQHMLNSVCTKIGIQMAAKLGGEPWALKIPPKDLMVIGYDTYHDSSDKRRSVGAFVASMNQTLTQWYSRATYHQNSEEMSSNFASNVLDAIKKYFDKKKSLPQRVVIYRDGVGDGMIAHVYDFELKQVQKALEKINKDNPPNLAFVIVTKRVNARFFAKEGRDCNNPIPGTVIDSGVTRLKRYDFYLISQSVRQGTVTPTMYNIIYDKTGFKAEHHQQLAYKLTHLYFNWPGTIRVPAPCQYAHKLAYLTGTSLHREPSNVMSDQLFYL